MSERLEESKRKIADYQERIVAVIDEMKTKEEHLLENAVNPPILIRTISGVVANSNNHPLPSTPLEKYFDFLKHPKGRESTEINYHFHTKLLMTTSFMYLEIPTIVPVTSGTPIEALVFLGKQKPLDFLVNVHSSPAGNLEHDSRKHITYRTPVIYEPREIQEAEKVLKITVNDATYSAIPDFLDLSSKESYVSEMVKRDRGLFGGTDHFHLFMRAEEILKKREAQQ